MLIVLYFNTFEITLFFAFEQEPPFFYVALDFANYVASYPQKIQIVVSEIIYAVHTDVFWRSMPIKKTLSWKRP